MAQIKDANGGRHGVNASNFKEYCKGKGVQYAQYYAQFVNVWKDENRKFKGFFFKKIWE